MPTVEIEYYVLIVSKSFFYIPIINKEEAHEKIIEIKKSGYATYNLLNYDYFSGYYRLIAIDFSKQDELEILDVTQQ